MGYSSVQRNDSIFGQLVQLLTEVEVKVSVTLVDCLVVFEGIQLFLKCPQALQVLLVSTAGGYRLRLCKLIKVSTLLRVWLDQVVPFAMKLVTF